MLKHSVLSAVASAKRAMGDLAVNAELVQRGTATVVPGSPPVYGEQVHPIRVVLTTYMAKEIDGERILASDVQGLIFPEPGVPVPEPNFFVRVGTKTWRVIHNNKAMAGDEVALSQVQLRRV